jgi:hypothetical protein
MTHEPAGTTASDYRCLALVEVPADKVALYDSLICQAAGIFKTHDWRLLIPGQNADLFYSSGAPPGLTRTLLQAWSIPDFDSLPQVMAYAADDPVYVQAQALALVERQNLYTALRWSDPLGLPTSPINLYMMETLHMINNDQSRNDFATYMDSAVYSMNTKYGWTIAFAGNATTGVINEYVNIWGVADSRTLEAAISEYRGNLGWSAAVARVTTSLWTPRSLPAFGPPSTAPATTA